MKHWKKILVFFVVFLVLLGVFYGGMVLYFMNHFYIGSTINGIDGTGKTVREVESILAEDVGDYMLTIYMPDGEKRHIRGSQIQMTYMPDGSVRKLKELQNPFLWFLALGGTKKHDMVVPTIYSKEKLKAIVNDLQPIGEQAEEAKDAYISFNMGQFVIIPEKEGNQLDLEQTYQLIVKSIDQGKKQLDLREEDCLLKPSVTSEDSGLLAELENLNYLSEMEITYDFQDRTEVLDGKTIQSWFAVKEGEPIVLDRRDVQDYVDTLARKYDTFGQTRSFITSKGEAIQVTGGDYGWLIDRQKEVDELVTLIQQGKSVEGREPFYTYKGYTREEDDIGFTYVEIDYSSQHLWFYKEGRLVVETDIVTGDMSRNFASPAGVFPIVYKQRDAQLVGEGYDTTVDYWMPFSGNVGLHDAPWREEFGGNLYINSGSHGCINLPPLVAETIYNEIDQGVPVVAYYLKNYVQEVTPYTASETQDQEESVWWEEEEDYSLLNDDEEMEFDESIEE